MKKVLFVATVTVHINSFHIPYLKMFKENGYEVHVASFGDEPIEYCDKHFNIPFARFPLKPQNYKAYKELKRIIEDNEYEIIHCHTPVGGVLTRLAARKSRKNGTRVIYTAHGFHFYKGAPLLNWIIYYPVEKYLAKYTDTLIAINKEDYKLAIDKFNKRCEDIQYIPGVGVNPDIFEFEMTQQEKIMLRKSLGLEKDDFVLIFPARLDKNKNQIFLIECMEGLMKEQNNIHLLLPGEDELNGYYQKIVRDKKMDTNIHFLGYREDIPKLMKISNVAVSSSLREGLPINVIEALICQLPVVALRCRGMEDLISNKKNGYLVYDNNVKDFINKILLLQDNKIENFDNKQFFINNVVEIMRKIYFKE